jgi:hypothetical protein
LTILHLDRSAWDAGAQPGPPPEVATLRITRDAPFAPTWDAHVRAVSAGRGRSPLVPSAR